MNIINIDNDILEITKKISEIFLKYFPHLKAYCVSDIFGEDHIYAIDENKKPMFDLMVSTARKFVFLWYYIHPKNGLNMVNEMKEIVNKHNLDLAIKFPNVPSKTTGYPSIIRYGKHPAGTQHEEFIIKAGNPKLTNETFTENNLNTYRDYNWQKVPDVLERILIKAKEMTKERLRKHPEKIKNIRGYCLYAGCAYHKAYPHLGFGMRDIDVQVFFSPEWFTNTRCAFTRNCGIEELGTPEYFKNKTRWLDLMWNSFHKETGDFNLDVNIYMNEMRKKSDRWATMSQRPFYNLETKELIYKPNWLIRLEKEIKL